MNCPIEVCKYLPSGQIWLGGWRKFHHSKDPEFQLVISSGDRLIIGLNVEDHFDAPFVKPWLEKPEINKMLTHPSLSESRKKSRKLNVARWAMCQALVAEIRDIDKTVTIQSRHFEPTPDDNSQVFIEGEFFCKLNS